MTRASLKAHRWILTTVLAVVLGGTGWVLRSSLIAFPLVSDPVPARALIGTGVSLVALLPLYAAVPELEDTLVREPPLRALRVALAALLAAAASTPAWSTAADPHWRGNATLLGLTLASGLIAVPVVGELAWAAPFSMGLLAILLDNGPEQRVTRTLNDVPTWVAVLLLSAAAAIYVLHGPRR